MPPRPCQMAARATFALKSGVWFRRGRRFMVSPDSQAPACPLSGRNSTYRPVQNSGAASPGAAWSRLRASFVLMINKSYVLYIPSSVSAHLSTY
jgi:hypothetical protein